MAKSLIQFPIVTSFHAIVTQSLGGIMVKFLNLFLATIALALGIAGPAVAEETVPSAVAKAKLEASAGTLALSSLQYMHIGGDIDRAVGHATIALDIARMTGNAELIDRLEKLLYAARTVNMFRTAFGLEVTGQSMPELKNLTCKMAKEAPKELRGTMQKFTGDYCTPI